LKKFGKSKSKRKGKSKGQSQSFAKKLQQKSLKRPGGSNSGRPQEQTLKGVTSLKKEESANHQPLKKDHRQE